MRMLALIVPLVANPNWYALKRPEWWLVVVGFFTLVLIWWQAKKTAEATEAMHKNITLQFRPRLQVRAMILISGDYVPVAGQSLEQEEEGELEDRIYCSQYRGNPSIRHRKQFDSCCARG